MLLNFVDRQDLLTERLREFAERRLRFALSRFGAVVRRVQVVVADVNGPRGGQDKLCRITVKLSHAEEVVVSEQDAALSACIARAVDRTRRAVVRAIERTQRVPRGARRSFQERS